MRSLLLALMLTLPSLVHAAPFTPDRFSAVTTRSYFDVSGTTSVCFECEDADLLNDVLFFGGAGVFATDLSFDFTLFQLGGGTFAVNSAAPPDPLGGPSSGITIEVMLSLWDSAAPELVSVTHGVLTGVISQLGVYAAMALSTRWVLFQPLLHCLDPFRIPLRSSVDVIIVLANAPQNPEFTPAPTAVPEPLSLLLLGSGLAAGFLRRQHARH